MCLIALRWRLPGARLLLASNRDEFHARPTDAADWWPAEGGVRLYGGRDRQSGGSWLAATADGRIAAVTNIRRMQPSPPDAPSRGALVADFCRGQLSPLAHAEALADTASRYAGFNLLLCDGEELVYASNGDGFHCTALAPGVHTLSNADLDTPWPKTERLRAALAAASAMDLDSEALFAALADDRPAADEALPDTGVGLDMERRLSPPFIRGRDYGTRASTLLQLAEHGELHIEERRYGPDGVPIGRSRARLA